jgi:4-amino-4-deoxy-L-arabinose transferase-like glycosyltransferase
MAGDAPDRLSRSVAVALGGALILGLLLRALYPLADPPWHHTIGITWHDEGVWAHNARNKVLWGDWRQDEWNPMYVSPVFTGLEFIGFSLFGVGLWQARLVSIVAGTLSIAAMAFGLWRRGAATAAVAALLLAVNSTWVMYSRVALLEASMVAFLVLAWAAYGRGGSWPWGVAAAGLALAAFFTKASAAFFLVALGLDALWVLLPAWRRGQWRPDSREGAMAAATLVALAAGTACSLALFVVPQWTEYARYNLEIYGARRSVMGLTPLVDRASWFPVIHGFFTRHWLTAAAACGGALLTALRYRRATADERLLLLWAVLGSAELVLHDLGNERRYVFLIPALSGLAALFIIGGRLLPETLGATPRRRLAPWLPALLAGGYVLAGALTRVPFFPQISPAVRLAALIAVVGVGGVFVAWPAIGPTLERVRWSRPLAWAIVAVIVAGEGALFIRWAARHTRLNYEASVIVGSRLPAGTPVQGKLANGLSLDNRIRPLFIGPGFGNYDDRHRRPDVRWILTYDRPRLGYEGAVIREVLDELPGWTIELAFPVAETTGGTDRAVLIRKPAGSAR